MLFGFSFSQISQATSEFFSQLTPGSWLQFCGIVVASILAIVGSRLAAKSAHKHAVRIQRELKELQDAKDQASEMQRVNAILHALREEFVQIWLMISDNIAGPIESVDSSTKRLPYWPCYQSYFSIYDRNAKAIGLLRNEQLRTSLIQTYTLAKRLLDQYQSYNRIEQYPLTESSPAQAPGPEMIQTLHAGALAVVETYQTLKISAERLRNLLDTELQLPVTHLPFINSPPITSEKA